MKRKWQKLLLFIFLLIIFMGSFLLFGSRTYTDTGSYEVMSPIRTILWCVLKYLQKFIWGTYLHCSCFDTEYICSHCMLFTAGIYYRVKQDSFYSNKIGIVACNFDALYSNSFFYCVTDDYCKCNFNRRNYTFII